MTTWCDYALVSPESRVPSPESRVPSPASFRREEIASVLVDQFQRTATAAGDAGQRVVGNLHVQAGFLGDQPVQVAQQRAAAGQHDATLGHVRAQLGRRLLQR